MTKRNTPPFTVPRKQPRNDNESVTAVPESQSKIDTESHEPDFVTLKEGHSQVFLAAIQGGIMAMGQNGHLADLSVSERSLRNHCEAIIRVAKLMDELCNK